MCPRTRVPLHVEGDKLCAKDGTALYRTRDGIANFLQLEPLEDADTRSKLERLTRLARIEGWRAALHCVYGDDPALIQYVTDPARAAFIRLLETTQRDVLEIGPGLGQFTAALAKDARCVQALEVVEGQAQFVAERCRQSGIGNVKVAAGGEDCRLPYPDAAFDIVVLNLVFEWCASRSSAEPTETVQKRLLAEIFRVLRPGGSLYLATKNRFALRILTGKPDEHYCGLRFASALPRWLADRLLNLRGIRRAPGRLYSHNGLRRMLRMAGFEKVDSLWAVPEMRTPIKFVPTDAVSIRNARRTKGFIQGELKSTQLLMRMVPAWLVRHFTPGLVFLAWKPR